MAKRGRRWGVRKTKKGPKKIAWDWMSRWVRLTAVLYAQKHYGVQFGDSIAVCYTCGKYVDVTKHGGGQAGHFKSRGSGGGSGLYFDERAIRVQCAKCNAWEQGRYEEYRVNLVKEYDEDTVQELERLNGLPSRWGPAEYPGLIEYYKSLVPDLLNKTGVRKWW